jgi:hypothetical protein
MDLAVVMDDLGSALGRIDGLRVFPFSADKVAPPAAVVLWPERIDYDATMTRGSDRITMPVAVLVGRVDQRSARDALARYMDGAGPHSVKAAVESFTGQTSWDSARVKTATPDSFTSGGVDYIGALFTIDIIGRGA